MHHLITEKLCLILDLQKVRVFDRWTLLGLSNNWFSCLHESCRQGGGFPINQSRALHPLLQEQRTSVLLVLPSFIGWKSPRPSQYSHSVPLHHSHHVMWESHLLLSEALDVYFRLTTDHQLSFSEYFPCLVVSCAQQFSNWEDNIPGLSYDLRSKNQTFRLCVQYSTTVSNSLIKEESEIIF